MSNLEGEFCALGTISLFLQNISHLLAWKRLQLRLTKAEIRYSKLIFYGIISTLWKYLIQKSTNSSTNFTSPTILFLSLIEIRLSEWRFLSIKRDSTISRNCLLLAISLEQTDLKYWFLDFFVRFLQKCLAFFG